MNRTGVVAARTGDLGDTVLRRSVGDQHILAVHGWRVTYNPGYLDIAFPPADEERVRSA